jgi:L-alanine-DL-glutamate epimerase-like enolase superfamily enzyme
MIDARIIELTLKHPWTISRATITNKQCVVASLQRGALVARGEAAPVSRFRESVETVLEALPQIERAISGDVRAYHHVSLAIAKVSKRNHAAKAAVDVILHDLVAKELGVPLHRLLGLDPRRAPRTSYSIGVADPAQVPERLAEAEGFSFLKVKLGQPNDRAVFRAVRDATRKPIRVDVNEGWKRKEEALDRIRELRGAGVELVEQPLPASDLEGARWLYERSTLPIIADEALRTVEDVPRLAGAYHGVNVKLQKCGGIGEAMRIVAAARAHGMKVMIGCMIESSLGIAAAAHIAALFDWVDLDAHLLLANDPFRGLRLDDGRVLPSDAPGLGVEPAG